MSKKKTRKSQAATGSENNTSASARSRTRNRPDDFNPDYTYVKKDLRTIGILAGIFITILVVLSFFI